LAKADLDHQVKDLTSEQSRASTLVTRLEVENKEQDRRLRSLELREKAGALIAQGNYELALEYLILGLEMTPNDTVMLRQRAQCLTRLGRLSEAIAVNENVLKLKPGDDGAIADLAEAYLLANRVPDGERIIADNASVIEKRSPILRWYFDAIILLLKGDEERLTEHVRGLLSLTPTGQGARMPTWSFQEVRAAYANRPDLAGKKIFFRAIDLIEGRIDSTALFPAAQLPAKEGSQAQSQSAITKKTPEAK
jgi:tetratricopeptide (TPR) repeat protein